MTVEVFAADEQSAQPVDAMGLVQLAKSVLAAQGVKADSELSMLFVDEDAMAELNKRFLGKDGPTDVLAFPIDDDDVVEGGRSPDSLGPGTGVDLDATDPPNLLGDVVVCPAVAARNAPKHAGTYEDEMALLVVHGILHILGHDHAEPDETAAMQAKEQAHLAAFHTRP